MQKGPIQKNFECRAVNPGLRLIGAGSGLVDPGKLATEMGFQPGGRWLFAYMFRRFGPPNSGSDDYKNLACWLLSTPRPDVFLSVTPYLLDWEYPEEKLSSRYGRGSLSFGYMLTKELDAKFYELAKVEQERIERYEKRAIAWARANLFFREIEKPLEDREPLTFDGQLSADKWIAYVREEGDTHGVGARVKGRTREIRRDGITTWMICRFYEKATGDKMPVPPGRRHRRSVMRYTEAALRATLRELRRPTNVRDLHFSPEGLDQGEGPHADYYEFAGWGCDLAESGRAHREKQRKEVSR